jgi:lipoate-protein ligase A
LAGPDAVARPLALLERLGPDDPPVISWSAVAAPVLVAGRGVRPAEINDAACRAAGIAVLHRRSGGGPVLWDAGLVSCDVVLPPGHPLADRDVTRAYAWLGEAVAAALGGLGVPATAIPLAAARAAQARSDPTSRTAARACFGGVSPFEVLDAEGRKLVGLAQARRAAGTIFQCGIALSFDARGLAAALGRDAADSAALAAALEARVASVRAYVPGLGATEVIAGVEAELVGRLGVGLAPGTLRPDELAAQAALAASVVAGRPA